MVVTDATQAMKMFIQKISPGFHLKANMPVSGARRAFTIRAEINWSCPIVEPKMGFNSIPPPCRAMYVEAASIMFSPIQIAMPR